MKNVMVSFRHHQGPMAAVLKRYGIGNRDKYNRGIWIGEKDLPAIKSRMESDPTNLGYEYPNLYVFGSCRHNYVCMTDFEKLFEA